MALRGSAVQPLNRVALSDQIVDALQQAIISGVYKPGQRLTERELSAAFHVSSIPVREALKELESRGLVSRRHNCGCIVSELSNEEIHEILRFREHMEPKMVEWACENLDGEMIARMQDQMERVSEAAERGDAADFLYQDLGLHRLIWEASGNRWAANALEMAIAPLFATGLVLSAGLGTPDLRAEARKHRRVLTAMIKGQAEEASRIMREIATGFGKHLEKRNSGS